MFGRLYRNEKKGLYCKAESNNIGWFWSYCERNIFSFEEI